MIPGITEFLAEFTNEDTWGDDGYLADKGLIPLTAAERETWSTKINALSLLDM